jgi:hypothetical protein
LLVRGDCGALCDPQRWHADARQKPPFMAEEELKRQQLHRIGKAEATLGITGRVTSYRRPSFIFSKGDLQ